MEPFLATRFTADGVSGMYHPDSGPSLFDGLTGGQMVVKELRRVITIAGPQLSLDTIVSLANGNIERANQKAGIKEEEVEMMPAATFALAKIGKESVELIQGGDCFALWMRRNGRTGISPNQVFAHDGECRKHISELMEKHGGNRAKMWEEFTPILTDLRRAHVNNASDPAGYCLLNGQPKMKKMLWRATVINPSILILSTDGLFAYGETGDEEHLVRNAMEVYHEKGLRALLARTRETEEKEKAKSHIDQAEATVIAITF